MYTPKERHREFARLYLNGPEGVKGNFVIAARVGGFKKIPERTSGTILMVLNQMRETLRKEGVDPSTFPPNPTENILPSIQQPTREKVAVFEDEPEEEYTPPPEDADVLALQEMTEAGGSWAEMAPLARRIMGKVGSGKIAASAQQVNALKEMIARAEGKVGQEKEEVDTGVVRVVLLPTINRGMGPVIDLGTVEDVDPGDTIPGLTLRQAVQQQEVV